MSPTPEPSPPAPPQRPFAPRPAVQMTIGCLVIPLLVVLLGLGAVVYLRAKASARLIVPEKTVVLVRTRPDDHAPLMARFGAGRKLDITGRTTNWHWLEVALWAGRHGWTRRPLDIFVWQLKAAPATPSPQSASPAVSPSTEEMIEIPATSFTMGSPPRLGKPDEHPAHVVKLSAFAIDRSEVTVGQYWLCVIAGACLVPSCDASHTEAHYFNDPAFDNHPVINVPWGEANHYCQWHGKRLPSEAEWELAAGWDVAKQAKRLWPWGNEAMQIGVNAGNAAADGPMTVGTNPADVSAAGVLDLGGNVSEWVFDWYKVDYYRVADPNDPRGPSPRRGVGTGRVVRGGSFADPLDEARASNRRSLAENYGYATVGFRCVQDR